MHRFLHILLLPLLALGALGCEPAYADATGTATKARTSAATNLASASSQPTPEEELVAALGADLLFWWQASPETVTLNGSNASAVEERVAGVRDLAQGTAANQPAYSATSCPNSQPGIAAQDVNRGLVAPTLGIGAGNRVGVYTAGAIPAVGGVSRFLYEVRTAAAGLAHALSSESTIWRWRAGFTGGGVNVDITSPADDSNFHTFAIRPLASGAVGQIDGVTTTNDLAGNDTCVALDSMRVFRVTAAHGTWCSTMLVNDPTDAKDTAIRAYYDAIYGL